MLKEVRYSDALAALSSKGFLKGAFNLLINSEEYKKNIDFILKKLKEHFPEISADYKNNLRIKVDTLSNDDYLNAMLYHFIVAIRGLVFHHFLPHDIDDKQKGQVVLWIKNILLQDKEIPKIYIKEILYLIGHEIDKYNFTALLYSSANAIEHEYKRDIKYYVTRNLELFFRYNGSSPNIPNFIEDGKNDLNKISSFEELQSVVDNAKPKYDSWLRKQEQKDAEAGTEKIIDDPEWEVYITHSKAANCKLAMLPNGKSADWCTAAPGLDWFDQYYRKDSPLFVFVSKKDPNWRAQFSYSARQFMDISDKPLPDNIREELHNLLLKYGIDKKYPIIKKV